MLLEIVNFPSPNTPVLFTAPTIRVLGEYSHTIDVSFKLYLSMGSSNNFSEPKVWAFPAALTTKTPLSVAFSMAL